MKATVADARTRREPDVAAAVDGLLRRSSIATRLVFFAVALVGVTAMLIGTLSYTRARLRWR